MVVRCQSMYTISRSGLAVGARVPRGTATSYQTTPAQYTEYVVAFRNVVHARHVQYNLQPEPSIRLLRDAGLDIDATDKFRSHDIVAGGGAGRGRRVVMNAAAVVHFPRMDTKRYPGYAGLHPMNDGGFNLDVVDPSDILSLPFLPRNTGIIITLDILADDGATIAMSCHVIDPIFTASLL
jgi:hypothetical protein